MTPDDADVHGYPHPGKSRSRAARTLTGAVRSRRAWGTAAVALLVAGVGAGLFSRFANADELPAGTYCQGAQAAEAAAGPTKVLMVVLENESATSIRRAGSEAAFMNGALSRQCGLLDTQRSATDISRNHSTTHGSEANYFALTSGHNASVDAEKWPLSDCPPDSTVSICTFGGGSFPAGTASIFSQLEAKAGASSWKTYAEDMTKNCQRSDGAAYSTGPDGKQHAKYVTRHNPAIYFAGIACATQDIPSGDWQDGTGAFATDVAGGNLPAFSLFVPNEIHNGHDPVSSGGTTIAGGISQIRNQDVFLKNFMDEVVAGPDYRSGRLVVIITFDEGTGSGTAGDGKIGQNCADPDITYANSSCAILTWFAGRHVAAATYDGYTNHFSILRTTQHLLGLTPALGHAADAGVADLVVGGPAQPNPFNVPH